MRKTLATQHGDGGGETFAEILSRRMARRSFLKGALAAAPLLVVGPSFPVGTAARHAPADPWARRPSLRD